MTSLIGAWRMKMRVGEFIIGSSVRKWSTHSTQCCGRGISFHMRWFGCTRSSSTVGATLLKYTSKHFVESPSEKRRQNLPNLPPRAPTLLLWYKEPTMRERERGSSDYGYPFPKRNPPKTPPPPPGVRDPIPPPFPWLC